MTITRFFLFSISLFYFSHALALSIADPSTIGEDRELQRAMNHISTLFETETSGEYKYELNGEVLEASKNTSCQVEAKNSPEISSTDFYVPPSSDLSVEIGDRGFYTDLSRWDLDDTYQAKNGVITYSKTVGDTNGDRCVKTTTLAIDKKNHSLSVTVSNLCEELGTEEIEIFTCSEG